LLSRAVARRKENCRTPSSWRRPLAVAAPTAHGKRPTRASRGSPWPAARRMGAPPFDCRDLCRAPRRSGVRLPSKSLPTFASSPTPWLFPALAGIGFGLTPALQASKADVNSALKEDSSAFGHRVSRSRLRSLLIAAQMAACLVLLIGFCFAASAAHNAPLTIDPGYESRHVLYLENVQSCESALFASAFGCSSIATSSRESPHSLAFVSVAQASRGPLGGNRWVARSAGRKHRFPNSLCCRRRTTKRGL